MATVTHYIHSHYNEKTDRKALEIATGQVPTQDNAALPSDEDLQVDLDHAWQTESAFGAQRRLANAPKFVPAIVSYDEVNELMGVPKHVFAPPVVQEPKSDVGSWYRSLQRERLPSVEAGPSVSSASSRASTAPVESSSSMTAKHTVTPPIVSSPSPSPSPNIRIRPDKNNWFIARALRSTPSSKPSSPAPTLADLLAREPPASSPEQAVQPPVFLALGPSNRGWGLLQQQGWTEGEGLGATAPRRQISREVTPKAVLRKDKGKEPEKSIVKREAREIRLDYDNDISEVKNVEVIDLTLSDSDEEADEADEVEDEVLSRPPQPTIPADPANAHSKPLLTPIATVLKSDRLGIGLKAKREGPYKASKKRVTHNQAALARHVKEAEELRRMKALVGRGSRGFARLAKADSEHRRQLLASLNSS